MALPLLGMIGGLALRFPKTTKFLGRYGKYVLIAVVIAGVWFAVVRYLDHRDDANYERGFGVAEQQAKDLIDQANARALVTQHDLDLVTQRFGFLAGKREAAITTIVQPQIERVTREVVENPVYRTCLLTDGLFDATNAAAAAVNTSIGAGASPSAR